MQCGAPAIFRPQAASPRRAVRLSSLRDDVTHVAARRCVVASEDFARAEAPAAHCQKPPRLRGGSLTFTLRPPRPRTEAPAHRKPPRLRGGSLTFTLRPRRRTRGSPAFTRGASPPEAPAFTRREPHLHPTPPAPRAHPEAPAFTRREPHLHPTPPPRTRHPGKPPRLRGGSLTFTLRPRRARRTPEAPAFTRREPHLHPTRPARHARDPGSPRVYAAGASPSPYV